VVAPLMVAEDITVSFGGVKAVAGVTLSLGPTEILGLVGPNGSGKTTFLNAISGVVAASGHLTVGGAPVSLGHPSAAWRAGIARIGELAAWPGRGSPARSCGGLRSGVGAMLTRP
jgi:branched-chain amino acid transport system permease protein